MKKLLLLTIAIALIACKQEPKDYVTLSGKITNKNSDSLVVLTRDYSKTIKVNEDGTFQDTLKVETGVYNLYDGSESASIFLKNGFDINITLDTKEFDETIKFTGEGAEHSNFLAEYALLQEELIDMDALSNLDLDGLDKEINTINTKLNAFYESNKQVDTSITNNLKKNLAPMMKFYKEYIGESISLKTDLAKGTPSPTFENYENYKGGTTSLSDLKGKYVYVDVWATWCGPCKAEIPSLKALEEEYHDKNIQFVSISIDDDRTHGNSREKALEDWKAMVADKELGGIQIMAPEGWKSKFVEDYRIKGIPRFILIDPNGNVVTPDAPRPSDAKLKELFTSLNI